MASVTTASDPMLHGSSQLGWVRPIRSLGFSGHTANFVAIQIFLLSRAFFAIQHPYEHKLSVIRICDWISVLSLLLGTLLVLPYVKQIFQSREIVVQGGPSLITDLIPQLITNAGLLFVLILAAYADNTVRHSLNFTVLVPVYFFLSLLGFAMSMTVHDSSRQVLIISSIGLVACIHQPKWFSDLELVVPASLGVCVLGMQLMWEGKTFSSVLTDIEIEVIRIRSVFLFLTGVCMAFEGFKDFGAVCLTAVAICNTFMHFHQRRLGTPSERMHLRIANL
jgi:hypothetical protein